MARAKVVTSERGGAAAEAIEAVCERIRAGAYLPGDRLPAERQLATDLRVSRPTMREAIQSLATLNIVEIRPGSGVYVSPLDAERLLRPAISAVGLSRPTARSLFEIRLALEPLAAALAARNAHDRQRSAIRACLAEGERAAPSPRHVLELDTHLHRLIADASGNDLICGLLASLAALAQRSREQTVRAPGVIEQTLADHQEIVTAIERRASTRAERAMRQHLEGLARVYGFEAGVPKS